MLELGCMVVLLHVSTNNFRSTSLFYFVNDEVDIATLWAPTKTVPPTTAMAALRNLGFLTVNPMSGMTGARKIGHRFR